MNEMNKINESVRKSFSRLANKNVGTETSTLNTITSTLKNIGTNTKKYVNTTSLELFIILFLVVSQKMKVGLIINNILIVI